MATQHPYYVTNQPAPAPQTPWSAPNAPVSTRGPNATAITGMVLAIVATVLSPVPVIGFLLGGAGFVLSQIGLIKSTKANYGRGQSITGLILSPLAMTVNTAATVAVVGFGALAEHNLPKYDDAAGEMLSIKVAVDAAHLETGKLPQSLNEVAGGFSLRDPWGEPYKYERTGTTYRIVSNGVTNDERRDDLVLSSTGKFSNPARGEVDREDIVRLAKHFK